MTQVLELGTNHIQYFSLPAPLAVIAAYEQSQGNCNTWTYNANHAMVQFGPSGRTVFCGQFGAIIAFHAHTERHRPPPSGEYAGPVH